MLVYKWTVIRQYGECLLPNWMMGVKNTALRQHRITHVHRSKVD